MKLKELRKAKGLTQQETADLLGLSQVTYSRYESGEREPSNEMLIKMALFFGVTVDQLLGVSRNDIEQEELDEFTAFRNRRRTNKEYDSLMKKAEKHPPEHIKAAIAVLDALDPFA